GDQRRGGRFAVRARDGDERRAGRDLGALAAEELDVADHLDARRLGELDRPMGLRMGERHAWREHESREAPPLRAAQILDREALAARLLDPVWRIIPQDRR